MKPVITIKAMVEYQTQTPESPLFPNVLWSRPERTKNRGNLVIIGGNSQEFVDVQTAYAATAEVGVAHAQIILPDALRRLLGSMPGVEFAASTPSGSFAQEAYTSMATLTNSADAVVLCGELSSNSETHIVIEKLAEYTPKPLILVGDSIMHAVNVLAERSHPTVIVGAKPAFQELSKYYELSSTITENSTPAQIRNALRELAIASKSILVLHHGGVIYIVDDQNCVQTESDSMNHPRAAVFIAEIIAEFPSETIKATASAVFMLRGNQLSET